MGCSLRAGAPGACPRKSPAAAHRATSVQGKSRFRQPASGGPVRVHLKENATSRAHAHAHAIIEYPAVPFPGLAGDISASNVPERVRPPPVCCPPHAPPRAHAIAHLRRQASVRPCSSHYPSIRSPLCLWSMRKVCSRVHREPSLYGPGGRKDGRTRMGEPSETLGSPARFHSVINIRVEREREGGREGERKRGRERECVCVCRFSASS